MSSPEGCCRLLEFQVCWQLIPRTWCGNSERSVADLAVCSWDDESLRWEACSDDRTGRSASGVIMSAMYCGACPISALWTSKHSLRLKWCQSILWTGIPLCNLAVWLKKHRWMLALEQLDMENRSWATFWPSFVWKMTQKVSCLHVITMAVLWLSWVS